MRYLLTIALLLLAAPAWAADEWVKTPGDTDDPCKLPGDRTCFYDTSTDSTTPAITTNGCRELTATCISDIADNTLHVNTCQVFRFFGSGQTADANDDEAHVLEDALLNGDPAADREAVYGFDSYKTYVKFDWTSGGASRIILDCEPH